MWVYRINPVAGRTTGIALKRRVLIIDDNPPFRAGLAALVGTAGHEVDSGASVGEAIRALAAGPTHLLLDLNLPDGNGTTVLRHVRANNLPVKVAVLSGTDDVGLLAEVDALRPDVVFRKPPDWDALLEWVSTVTAA